MTNLIALIETKSNYNNLNGKWVAVKNFFGTIVECEIKSEFDSNVLITTTFTLNEIKQIKQIN